MDPIIYIIPASEEKINVKSDGIKFEVVPNPKLIKYGFNTITEKIDLESITSVPQYRAGLDFDFESKTDAVDKLNSLFAVKNIDMTFAEFWEIIFLYGFFKSNQNIYTNQKETMDKIILAYKKLTNNSNNYNYTYSDKNATLTMYKFGDSNVDIDENVGIQLLFADLPKILSAQTKGSSMVLQLFGSQTQISAEIIYYLSSLYTLTYLTKPIVISELSNSRYIVLTDLISDNILFPNSFKKMTENMYLASIGIQNIPNNISNAIQCINSTIIPMRYNKYNKIKSYINSKVYEGSTYQELIASQNQNISNWIEKYTNFEMSDKILESAIASTTNKCGNYSQLVDIIS